MNRDTRQTLKGMIAVLAAAALLAGSAACSRSAREKETAQAVSDFAERIDRIVRNDEASWPPDLPEDVPPFTRAAILSADKALTANGTSWTIRLSDVEEGAFDAYFGALDASGWATTTTQFGPDGRYEAHRESFELVLSFSGKQGTLVVRLISF